MLKYRWNASVFDADATLVGQEIEKIEVEGKVERDDLLNYAKKNNESELYKCFEWDDSIAGEKYRKHQANQILASLQVVIKENEKTTQQESLKAYVVVKDENNKNSYKNISLVMKNDEEYNQIKKRAYESFLATKEKYEKLIELQDLKDVVFDLYKSI